MAYCPNPKHQELVEARAAMDETWDESAFAQRREQEKESLNFARRLFSDMEKSADSEPAAKKQKQEETKKVVTKMPKSLKKICEAGPMRKKPDSIKQRSCNPLAPVRQVHGA
jgi:hypothetical protein